MSKFTVFTVILSVSVITIFGDLLVRDYVQSDGMASVLNSGAAQDQNQEDVSPVLETDNSTSDEVVTADPEDETTNEPTTISESATTTPSASEENTASASVVSFVTQELVKNAGFAGNIEPKQFSGKLFSLLDFTSFPVERINTYMIQADSVSAASVTEVVLRDEIQALQLYLLLQNKTKPYIDLSLNETNAYGDRSFYVNHKDKPNEAFLTVKIRNRIYGFAYVKFYHPELKKLITLLTEAK